MQRNWRLMAVAAGLPLLVTGGGAAPAGTDSGLQPVAESPSAVAAAEADRIRLHLDNVESAL